MVAGLTMVPALLGTRQPITEVLAFPSRREIGKTPSESSGEVRLDHQTRAAAGFEAQVKRRQFQPTTGVPSLVLFDLGSRRPRSCPQGAH